MSVLRPWLGHWRIGAAGLAAVAAFAVLAGRFWHPYYGFTKFIQLDEADARAGIHEVRENPVFTYDGFNGYDGAAYAQIAYHPLLDSAELQPALGNVPYRARRILGSAFAWILSLGNPVRIANVYASLNLAVWLVLAVVLWRILPVHDARSWLAWAGVLFSAGALHSVRLALTDLLAATLVPVAISMGERGRNGRGIGVLATAGLARETALAAVVGLWPAPWKSPRTWPTVVTRTVLVAAPLVIWVAYVRWKAGPAAQGLGNFTWPLIGWMEKWVTTFADYPRYPDFTWLNTTTLLSVIALTAQAVYFLRRLAWENPWWRVGSSGVAMMVLLGTSVWEGHPGAATRVLLPMGVAFAVVAVRDRASIGWIAAGSLTIFSGILALWHVPDDPREVAAGWSSRAAFTARLDSGWYGVERQRGRAWGWSANRATVTIKTSPPVTGPIRTRLKLRAVSARELEIREANAEAWRGQIAERATWIEFATTPRENGDVVLELITVATPAPETAGPDARQLGFALYGVELK